MAEHTDSEGLVCCCTSCNDARLPFDQETWQRLTSQDDETSATYGGRVGDTGNVYIDSLVWGQSWDVSTPITYYFDNASSSSAWQPNEIAAYEAALETWSDVANVTFQQVATAAEANFIETLYTDSPGNLGFHGVPGGRRAVGGYNENGYGWDAEGLTPGGLGFATLVHEIGHGLGLAHPHDGGGGSGIFPGVGSAFGDFGDNDLNQGIFTIMSYNGGYQSELGFAPGTAIGDAMGPMAFDIAAIQAIYGANMSARTGDDTYTLPDANRPGTGWSAIWDAGGTDEIVHTGSRGATIDLNAATLENSPTGGGAPSYADGIYGGFTIANGVVIENASGGSGADTIIGNAAANILAGNGGNDTVSGGGGDDILVYTAGDDVLSGGAGRDTANFRPFDAGVWVDLDYAGTEAWTRNNETLATGTWDRIADLDGIESLTGTVHSDFLSGDSGDNTLTYSGGFDWLYGDGGTDAASFADFGSAVWVDLARAGLEGWTRNASDLTGGTWQGITDLDSIENLSGTAFDDYLAGDATANLIDGGGGDDRLRGGDGADTFLVEADFGDDVIVDFDAMEDFVQFSDLGFETGADAIAQARNEGSSVVFEIGDDTLTLANTQVADLGADNVFV